MTTRAYEDRCPGVFRPWQADDGAIVRLRTPGGRVTAASLRALVTIAKTYADGTVMLTKRANLQLRGIRAVDGRVPAGLVADLHEAGLLPSVTHELVRNVVSSPLTGRVGGRLDLRLVVAELDRALCADPALADLGGRFLFVLDDGRGDVLGRPLDLGLVAVSEREVQIRIGSRAWGPVVSAGEAPGLLAGLARRFQDVRGSWWHVDEVSVPVAEGRARDARTEVASGPVLQGRYRQADENELEVVEVPGGLVTRAVAERLLGYCTAEFVVTPWRSIVVPDLQCA